MSSEWPEKPFQLITSTGAKTRTDVPPNHYCRRNAQIMALTHNTIFRGLNAIYNQAPQVLPGTQDAADLLFYCEVVYDFIHNHHIIEETIYFPEIEEAAGIPGLMDENVEQHSRLHEGLEKLRKYAAETKEAYNADTLRDIIDGLAGPLGEHLHEEIPTILDLHDKVDSKTLKKIYGHMHDAAEKGTDGFKTGPFVLGCQDRSFLLDREKIPFPEVPWIVPYIVDYVVAWRYARVWRFNPSNMHGEVKKLDTRTTNTTSLCGPSQVSIVRSRTLAVLAILCSLVVGYLATYMVPILEKPLLRGE